MKVMDLIRTRAAIKAHQIKSRKTDRSAGMHADYPVGRGVRSWLRDAGLFVLCRYAFKLVIMMPQRFSNNRLYFWLLGWAGVYAYSESWRDFRGWSQWFADGKPTLEFTQYD